MKDDLKKYKYGEYGFYTLAHLVDLYMAQSFNNGRKYYKNMLIIAAMMWKELYWKTLRVTKTKRVKVDRTTMTVRIPHDSMKVVAVRVIDDCNHAQPLTYDAYKVINPAHEKGCGCKSCECTTEVCGYMNGISYVTEDVELNDQLYQRIIKTKVCRNGDLIKEITEPFAQKNALDQIEILFKTYAEYVAPLTLKPCGCIEATEKNIKTCHDFGGCPVVCCSGPVCDDTEIPVPANVRGHYKIDTECGLIYLFDSAACYAEIIYISNGEECATEIMIPEYCSEAMFALLYVGSIRFRQGGSVYDKRAAKQEAAHEKQELYEFLNPIVPHELKQLQYEFPKW